VLLLAIMTLIQSTDLDHLLLESSYHKFTIASEYISPEFEVWSVPCCDEIVEGKFEFLNLTHV
jgi:hypothetical protein